ncbi:MAG: phosphatase PAP2 family protein [Rhodospirillaceae bacterium]|nr:phosphatase PAP2 family protein [Rhodospirillaceae bacterium]
MTQRSPLLAPAFLIYTVLNAAAIVALMLWGDDDIARWFRPRRDTAWAAFFAAITDFASGWLWYSVALTGLAGAYVRYRSQQLALGTTAFTVRKRAWVFMIVAMATSGIIGVALKFAIGRDRPRFLFEDGGATFHPFRMNTGDSSFPSGHAQSITSAMLALALIYPPLRPVFIVVAALIAASRTIIGAHYASDVLGGVWLAVAAVIFWRHRFEANGEKLDLTLARARPPGS